MSTWRLTATHKAVVALTTVAAAVALAVLLAPRAAAAEDVQGRISIKIPSAATALDAGAGRSRIVRSLRIQEMPPITVELYDAQYGRKGRYLGQWLGDLLEQWRPRAAGPTGDQPADMVLLQFADGVMIPLPLDDGGRPSVRVFVSWLRWDGKRWTSKFPPVTRDRAGYADVRPTLFHGNKVVVTSLGHPLLAKEAAGVFSPWQYADSLVGVEFVQSEAWYRQFNVQPTGDAQTRADAGLRTDKGMALFRSTCQFCHGARGVGAKFGWDFVEPLAVPEYMPSGLALLYHIRHRQTDAAAKGLQMPALKWMEAGDARELLKWLTALGEEPLRPYVPRSKP